MTKAVGRQKATMWWPPVGLLRISCDDRFDFFKKAYFLKEYILKTYDDDIGKFSDILKLDDKQKTELFEKITEIFGANILDPLIIVSHFDDSLRKVFYDKNNTTLIGLFGQAMEFKINLSCFKSSNIYC